MAIRMSLRTKRILRAAILSATLGLGVHEVSFGHAVHKGQAMSESDSAAIRSALSDSADAWTRGDLKAFMRCYEHSPTTSYINGQNIVQGYQAIEDMYASRFGHAAGAMGRLSMMQVAVRQLDASFALVTGRFELQREGIAPATGIFTLVFHKSSAGWGIISDHTS